MKRESVSKNRRKRAERKAHGTRRQRHIMKIGEEASTEQLSVRMGGCVAAGNPPAYPLRVNRLAQQIIGGNHG
jgi:hypothetical protein